MSNASGCEGCSSPALCTLWSASPVEIIRCPSFHQLADNRPTHVSQCHATMHHSGSARDLISIRQTTPWILCYSLTILITAPSHTEHPSRHACTWTPLPGPPDPQNPFLQGPKPGNACTQPPQPSVPPLCPHTGQHSTPQALAPVPCILLPPLTSQQRLLWPPRLRLSARLQAVPLAVSAAAVGSSSSTISPQPAPCKSRRPWAVPH